MRFDTTDRFWLVCDPTPESTMNDIFQEISLRDLELQFRGGLTCDRNPSIFTSAEEAEADATVRLVALKAAQAIARGDTGDTLRAAARVDVYDEKGNVLFRGPISGNA